MDTRCCAMTMTGVLSSGHLVPLPAPGGASFLCRLMLCLGERFSPGAEHRRAHLPQRQCPDRTSPGKKRYSVPAMSIPALWQVWVLPTDGRWTRTSLCSRDNNARKRYGKCVFLATEHDYGLCLRCRQYATCLPLVSMLGSGETPSDRNCNQASPEIGVTATRSLTTGRVPTARFLSWR